MKKKVLHYVQDYLKLTTIWIYEQIRNNQNYEPVVVTKKKINEKSFPIDNIYSLQDDLFLFSNFYNKFIFRIFGYVPYFYKVALRKNVSLIHAHFGHVGHKALKLKKMLEIPLITSFYGYDLSALAQKKKYQKRYKVLFSQGDLFLVEGNHMKSCLISLGCPEKKVEVFHLGVDVDKISFRIRELNQFRKDKNIKLLFAAAFTEKKALEYALKAFHIVVQKYNHLKFRIIGEGEEKEKIFSLISHLNLESYISYSGFLSYEDLIKEIYDSDIFIQPSITAKNGNTEGGAPVSLIDASATGALILSSFHADIPEVVIHKKTGLLSKERDIEGLANNLVFFIENPDRWESFSVEARKHVELNYNIKNQGKYLANIYNNIQKRT